MFKEIPKTVLAGTAPVRELQKVTVDVERNGSHEIDVNFQVVDVSSPDYVKNLPTYEEYTLENMLQSGVPLEAVPVGTLLNPTNAATLERLGLQGSINALELRMDDDGKVYSNLTTKESE